MNVTKVRDSLANRMGDLGSVQVWLAPTEYGQTFGPPVDARFTLKVMVGPADGENVEELVDDLFEEVPQKLLEDPTLDGAVEDAIAVSCSGHRLYGPDGLAMMGAEWIVRVVGKED